MALDPQPPLPAPPILAPPAGWLGFLGIKSGGQQPRIVNPTLLATIDMFQFYLAGQRTELCAQVIAAGLNSGQTNAACGPGPGKAWIIQQANADTAAPLGAAANVTGYLRVDSNIGNGHVYIGDPSPVIPTGSVGCCHINGPIIMVAGDVLAIVTAAAAAFTAFNWRVQAYGVEVSA